MDETTDATKPEKRPAIFIPEFEKYLDFWLAGQRQGFAGTLQRIKLPDGSKMVALYEHPLLYTDRWYGSDTGGGQAVLYKLDEAWIPERPFHIYGSPIARLGYSGGIARKFELPEVEALRKIFGELSQSDIAWVVLKSALFRVSRDRPLRGPEFFSYPEYESLRYISMEKKRETRVAGKEELYHTPVAQPFFAGNYDFTLIKKNLGDALP